MTTAAQRVLSTLAFEERITDLHMKAFAFSKQVALTASQVKELESMSKELLRAAMYGDLVGEGQMNKLAMVKELVDSTLNKFKGA